MYLIKQVPSDPKLLEMCFDCSNFQYQLKDAKKPVEDHIFQTIFLNKKDKETWTIDEIKEDKISRSTVDPPAGRLGSRLMANLVCVNSSKGLVASA